jgi:glycosyltransferase involved in cell wall biosynthesis
LATSLPKDKFEPIVAAGGDGILLKKLSESRVKTFSIPSLERDISLIREIRAFKFLLKIFRKECPDIIHLNSAKASAIGALAGRIAGIPKIIQTIHGWSFNEKRSFLWRSFVWLASWTATILTHKSIMVSKHDFKQAQRMPFVKYRTICIQNAIKEQTLMESERARTVLSKDDNIPKGKNALWIGTIAELHKNKGIEHGIYAMKEVLINYKHVYWLIIGDGEEHRNLQKMIDINKMKKHIFLLGYHDNAAKFLKAFDIFMLPSLKEGLPYVLLEARASGVPIISTSVGGIPEIVLNTSGIIVPPKNPKKLAEAIEILLSHKISLEKGDDDFNTMLEKTLSHY